MMQRDEAADEGAMEGESDEFHSSRAISWNESV